MTRDALDRVVRPPVAVPPPAPPAPAPPRPALRLRLTYWQRRLRLRLAVRLVRPVDGTVVSRATYGAVLDRLAQLVEWGDRSGAFRGRAPAARAFDAQIEDVTRLVVLAVELGDPALQLEGLQQRFALVRLRAMSHRKRARLEHEAGLRALEAKRRPAAHEARALAGQLGGAGA